MKEFLKGSNVLVARRFGPNIKRMLTKFVCVVIRGESVPEALSLLQQNFNLLLQQKSDEERKHLVLGNAE